MTSTLRRPTPSRSLSSSPSRGRLVLVVAILVAVGATAQESEPAKYAGRSLVEALTDLQSRGVRIIYSSDLVKATMRVEQPIRREVRGLGVDSHPRGG